MDTEDIKTRVGREIRWHRLHQHLSLSKLADMAGTSYPHLWKVEMAQVNAGIDLLGRIADALNVPLRDLIDPLEACAPCTSIDYQFEEDPEHFVASQAEAPGLDPAKEDC